MTRYIDADELKKQFCEDCGRMYDNLNCKEEECAVIDVVDMMPTIDVQPVAHAEWELVNEDENVYMCSNCGDEFIIIEGTPTENHMIYCPFCGAKMDEKEVK